jgi:hypothetical protein
LIGIVAAFNQAANAALADLVAGGVAALASAPDAR